MKTNKRDTAIEVTLTYAVSELTDLIEKTNKANPSPTDRKALEAAFAKYPDLWRLMGDFARLARKRMLASSSASYLMTESVTKAMEYLERELGYEGAPMASKLAIEQVVTCWLDLSDVQRLHAAYLSDPHSLNLGQYWDARLTRAQARYLRALETLAKINRLYRVVPVQVNIAAQGGQQINMARTGGEC